MPTDLYQLAPLRNPFGFEIFAGGSAVYDSLSIEDIRHRNAIISVVLEGEVEFGEWMLVSGDYMFHPARIAFSERSSSKGWHLWLEFAFHTESLSNRPAVGRIQDLKEYKQAFDLLGQLRSLNTIQEEAVHATTFFRLVSLIENLPTQVERKPHILIAIKKMESCYHEPLSRESLSDLAGMHPNAFDRSFRKSEGIAPMEFLRNVRLDAFKKYLRETDWTIEEISIRCGLSGAAYGSRFFKELTSVAPTEYRMGVKKTRNGYYSEL